MSFFGVFSGDNDEADQPLESNETLFQEMLSKARLDAAEIDHQNKELKRRVEHLEAELRIPKASDIGGPSDARTDSEVEPLRKEVQRLTRELADAQALASVSDDMGASDSEQHIPATGNRGSSAWTDEQVQQEVDEAIARVRSEMEAHVAAASEASQRGLTQLREQLEFSTSQLESERSALKEVRSDRTALQAQLEQAAEDVQRARQQGSQGDARRNEEQQRLETEVEALRTEVQRLEAAAASASAEKATALDQLQEAASAATEAEGLRLDLEKRAEEAEARLGLALEEAAEAQQMARSAELARTRAAGEAERLQDSVTELEQSLAQADRTNSTLGAAAAGQGDASDTGRAGTPTKGHDGGAGLGLANGDGAPHTPNASATRYGTKSVGSPGLVSPQLANAFLGAITQQLSPQKAGRAGEGGSDSSMDYTGIQLAALADASSTFVSEHDLVQKARRRLKELRESLVQEAEATWQAKHAETMSSAVAHAEARATEAYVKQLEVIEESHRAQLEEARAAAASEVRHALLAKHSAQLKQMKQSVSDQAKVSLDQYQGQLDKAQAALVQATEEGEASRAVANEATQQATELQQGLLKAHADLSAEQARAQQFDQTVRELRAAAQSYSESGSTQLDETRAELQASIADATRLQAEVVSANAKVQDLEWASASASEREKSLVARLQELQAAESERLASDRAAASDAEGRLGELVQAADEARAEAKAAKEESAERQEKYSELQDALNAAIAQASAYKEKLEHISQEHDVQTAAAATSAAAMQQEIDSARQLLAKAQAERDAAMEKASAAVSSAHSELLRRATAAEAQCGLLRGRTEDAEQSVQSLMERAEAAEIQLQRATMDRDQARAAVDDLDRKLGSATQMLMAASVSTSTTPVADSAPTRPVQTQDGVRSSDAVNTAITSEEQALVDECVASSKVMLEEVARILGTAGTLPVSMHSPGGGSSSAAPEHVLLPSGGGTSSSTAAKDAELEADAMGRAAADAEIRQQLEVELTSARTELDRMEKALRDKTDEICRLRDTAREKRDLFGQKLKKVQELWKGKYADLQEKAISDAQASHDRGLAEGKAAAAQERSAAIASIQASSSQDASLQGQMVLESQQRAKAAAAEAEAARAESRRVHEDLAACESRLKSTQAELAHVKQASEAQLDALRTDLRQALERADDVSSQMRAAASAHGAELERVASAGSEGRSEALKRAQAAVATDLEEKHARDLQAKMEAAAERKLAAEREAAEKVRAELAPEIEVWKQRARAAKDQFKKARAVAEKVAAEKVRAVKQLEAAQAELDKRTSELEAIAADARQGQAAEAAIAAAKAAAQSELEQLRASMQSALDKARSDVEAAQQSAESEQTNLKRDHAHAMEAQESRLNGQHQSEVAEARAVALSEGRRESEERTRSELSMQHRHELEQVRSSSQQLHEEQEARIQLLREEVAKLSDTQLAADALQAQLREAEAKIASLESSLAAALADLEIERGVIASREKQYQESQSSSGSAQEQLQQQEAVAHTLALEQLSRELDAVRSELESSKHSSAENERRAKHLQQQVEANAEELMHRDTQHRLEVDQARSEHTTAKEALVQAQEELAATQKELDSARTQIADTGGSTHESGSGAEVGRAGTVTSSALFLGINVPEPQEASGESSKDTVRSVDSTSGFFGTADDAPADEAASSAPRESPRRSDAADSLPPIDEASPVADEDFHRSAVSPQVKELETRISQLKAQLEAQTERNQELEAALGDAQGELAIARNSMAAAAEARAREISSLQEQLERQNAAAREEASRHAASSGELQQRVQSLERSREEAEQARQAAESSTRTLERLRTDLENRVNSLERQVDDSQGQRIDLERKLRNSERECADLSMLNTTVGSTSTAGTQASMEDTQKLLRVLSEQEAQLCLKSEDLREAELRVSRLEIQLQAAGKQLQAFRTGQFASVAAVGTSAAERQRLVEVPSPIPSKVGHGLPRLSPRLSEAQAHDEESEDVIDTLEPAVHAEVDESSRVSTNEAHGESIEEKQRQPHGNLDSSLISAASSSDVHTQGRRSATSTNSSGDGSDSEHDTQGEVSKDSAESQGNLSKASGWEDGDDFLSSSSEESGGEHPDEPADDTPREGESHENGTGGQETVDEEETGTRTGLRIDSQTNVHLRIGRSVSVDATPRMVAGSALMLGVDPIETRQDDGTGAGASPVAKAGGQTATEAQGRDQGGLDAADEVQHSGQTGDAPVSDVPQVSAHTHASDSMQSMHEDSANGAPALSFNTSIGSDAGDEKSAGESRSAQPQLGEPAVTDVSGEASQVSIPTADGKDSQSTGGAVDSLPQPVPEPTVGAGSVLSAEENGLSGDGGPSAVAVDAAAPAEQEGVLHSKDHAGVSITDADNSGAAVESGVDGTPDAQAAEEAEDANAGQTTWEIPRKHVSLVDGIAPVYCAVQGLDDKLFIPKANIGWFYNCDPSTTDEGAILWYPGMRHLDGQWTMQREAVQEDLDFYRDFAARYQVPDADGMSAGGNESPAGNQASDTRQEEANETVIVAGGEAGGSPSAGEVPQSKRTGEDGEDRQNAQDDAPAVEAETPTANQAESVEPVTDAINPANLSSPQTTRESLLESGQAAAVANEGPEEIAEEESPVASEEQNSMAQNPEQVQPAATETVSQPEAEAEAESTSPAPPQMVAFVNLNTMNRRGRKHKPGNKQALADKRMREAALKRKREADKAVEAEREAKRKERGLFGSMAAYVTGSDQKEEEEAKKAADAASKLDASKPPPTIALGFSMQSPSSGTMGGKGKGRSRSRRGARTVYASHATTEEQKEAMAAQRLLQEAGDDIAQEAGIGEGEVGEDEDEDGEGEGEGEGQGAVDGYSGTFTGRRGGPSTAGPASFVAREDEAAAAANPSSELQDASSVLYAGAKQGASGAPPEASLAAASEGGDAARKEKEDEDDLSLAAGGFMDAGGLDMSGATSTAGSQLGASQFGGVAGVGDPDDGGDFESEDEDSGY